jgi:hypothetical protein
MAPLRNLQVEVQPSDDAGGWVVIVGGQRVVIVPTETRAVEIAKELAGWLRRESRTSRA